MVVHPAEPAEGLDCDSTGVDRSDIEMRRNNDEIGKNFLVRTMPTVGFSPSASPLSTLSLDVKVV
jgi:hypothetical protein